MTRSRPAAIMDMDPGVWQSELGLTDAELPVAIIGEGSWWREQRTAWRLGYLDNVRELGFPDMFWGTWHDRPVLYCCAYGAPRAVEFAHVGCCLGASLAVQIGTCGGLQSGPRTGDIVVPDTAACEEGIARIYGAGDDAPADPAAATQAEALLAARGHVVHRGRHLTWYSIFAQTTAMVRSWRETGYLSVDMETATTFAVARHFNMSAVSMLVVWDELLKDRSFMDPLNAEEQERLDAGNTSVFEVALALIDGV